MGDSFDELVTTDDKYVLLFGVANFCSHCKKVKPIYKELAEKLADEADVVIADMECTENEHPLFPVSGFPTIRLFKPGSKTPVDYNSERDLKSFVKFLEEQVGRTFDGLKSEDL